MNVIWAVLICGAVIFSIFSGNFNACTAAMFDAAKSAVEMCLYLLGIVALWMGLTRILEDSGLIYRISHIFRPLLSRIFKGVPGDHPSLTSITLNLIANFFGLGNAATPLGIKAMKDLQTLNPDPETVSFDMMLFIVINTSSIQLIPFTVIGLLADYGSRNPSAIVLPTIIATAVSSVAAVLVLFAFRAVADRGKP